MKIPMYDPKRGKTTEEDEIVFGDIINSGPYLRFANDKPDYTITFCGEGYDHIIFHLEEQPRISANCSLDEASQAFVEAINLYLQQYCFKELVKKNGEEK